MLFPVYFISKRGVTRWTSLVWELFFSDPYSVSFSVVCCERGASTMSHWPVLLHRWVIFSSSGSDGFQLLCVGFFFFCSGSVKLQTCWSRCDKCWFLKDRVQTVNTDDQQFALQLNARLHSSNSGFSVLKLYTLTITDVTWFLCYFAVRCASDMSSHDIITLSGVFPWCCGVAAGRTDFLWFSNVRLVEQETVKGVK